MTKHYTLRIAKRRGDCSFEELASEEGTIYRAPTKERRSGLILAGLSDGCFGAIEPRFLRYVPAKAAGLRSE
jgi:hypothetical protein